MQDLRYELSAGDIVYMCISSVIYVSVHELGHALDATRLVLDWYLILMYIIGYLKCYCIGSNDHFFSDRSRMYNKEN